MSLLSRAVRVARQVLETTVRERARGRSGATATDGSGGRGQGAATGRASGSGRSRPGPGTRWETPAEMRTVTVYDGPLPPLEYAPEADDEADPGELVWAWVPYDENDGRGKDRPVLVIARHRGGYLGLQTTSKDHDRDREQEARWGRHWFDIGRGAWDSQGRESEVRLDRVLHLPADAVRREGASLDRRTYDAVAAALLALRERQGR